MKQGMGLCAPHTPVVLPSQVELQPEEWIVIELCTSLLEIKVELNAASIFCFNIDLVLLSQINHWLGGGVLVPGREIILLLCLFMPHIWLEFRLHFSPWCASMKSNTWPRPVPLHCLFGFALTSACLLIPGMLTCYKKQETKIKVLVMVLLGGHPWKCLSDCVYVCCCDLEKILAFQIAAKGFITCWTRPSRSIWGYFCVSCEKTWYFY